MNLKGGILIIGSLLWDPDQGDNKNLRKRWRSKRLSMSKKIHVKAPIRYGRRSGKRNNLTMIFSKDCDTPEKLGTAYLVPLQNVNIKSNKGIENQARYLSLAEGASDNKLKKGVKKEWCTIGILFNPKINQDTKAKILKWWKALLLKDGGLKDISIYKSILSDDGEININWSKAVNPNEQKLIDELDFVLATCTRPTENPYPDEKTIVSDIVSDERRYFFQNIQNGISTYQDKKVVEI